MRTVSQDASKELRRNALRSLLLTKDSIFAVFSRLRDVDPEIPLQLIAKINKIRGFFELLRTCDVYALVYEGFSRRDCRISQEFQAFLRNLLEESGIFKEKFQRNAVISFTKRFQLEETLKRPRFYQCFSRFFEGFLAEAQEKQLLQSFFKEVFKEMREIIKNPRVSADLVPEELFLLRVALTSRKETAFFEDFFPTLFEFLAIIRYFLRNKSLWGLYECIKIAGFQLNFEEKGKEGLIEFLKELCLDVNALSQENFPVFYEKNTVFNEYFEELSRETLSFRTITASFCENPAISCLNDLLQEILQLLYKVFKDSELFLVTVLEIISELKDEFEESADSANLRSFFLQNVKKLQVFKTLREKVSRNLEIARKSGSSQETHALLQETRELSQKIEALSRENSLISLNIERLQLRCLRLFIALLGITPLNLKNSGNASLLRNFLSPLLLSNNKEVQALSCKALGLYVSLEKKLALEYLPVFLEILAQNCAIELKIVSFHTICDVFLLFSASGEDQEELSAEFLAKFLEILKESLYNCEKLRNVAYEAATKLVFLAKIREKARFVEIVVHLLMFWLENRGDFLVQMGSLLLRKFEESANPQAIYLLELALEALLRVFLVLYKENASFSRVFCGIQPKTAGFLGNFLKYAGVLLRKRAETREIREKLAPCEVFFVFLCRIFAVYSADAQISELFAKNSQIFEEWLGDLCAEKALFFEKLLGKAISEARDSKKCKELLRLKQKLAEKTGGYSKLCSELKDLLRFDREREGFTQKVLNEVFALWKKHGLLSNSRINLNKYSIQCCF